MKVASFIFFIFLIVTVNAQERTLSLTDSLIKILHVKSKVKNIGDGGVSEMSFYDKNGNIYQIIDYVPGDTPMIKTNFVYDSSGRLYSSTRQVCKDYLHRCVLMNPVQKCTDTLTTYYECYADLRIKRAFIQDSSGNILSEVLYKYDSLQIITKLHYPNTIIESTEYYEKPNVITSFVDKYYNVNGKVLLVNKSIYKNKYNRKGQLIKTKFRKEGAERSCVKFYDYYENGLIKSKFGDNCLFNWIISYNFY